jgi:hypothetical protein
LNLIRVFDFYLAMMFVVGSAVRYRQYETIVRLVRAVPERWPRLLGLVREHHAIFVSWSTALPALLAALLSLLHMLACRLLWPHADLNISGLLELRTALPAIVLFGMAMIGVDLYATFTVGQLDRTLLEGYFDQAEYWLRSWVAPVVNIFTLGYINPRRMVAAEVRKALLQASWLLNTTLWWVSMQVGLRIAFGLSLWVTYALS